MGKPPKFISELIENKVAICDILERVNQLITWMEKLIKDAGRYHEKYEERFALLETLRGAQSWLKDWELNA